MARPIPRLAPTTSAMRLLVMNRPMLCAEELNAPDVQFKPSIILIGKQKANLLNSGWYDGPGFGYGSAPEHRNKFIQCNRPTLHICIELMIRPFLISAVSMAFLSPSRVVWSSNGSNPKSPTRKLYKKKKYVDRPKLKSFQSKPSPHVVNAKKMYNVSQVVPSKELSKASKCSMRGVLDTFDFYLKKPYLHFFYTHNI